MMVALCEIDEKETANAPSPPQHAADTATADGGVVSGEQDEAFSSDSGHESSAASTPEALTPHEERSNTPPANGVLPENDSSPLVENGLSATEELVSYASDAVYRLKIVSPGSAEPFELQVNSGEMVQELHQVLLERDSTCHRTCFSLQLDGQSLDHFTELKSIPGMRDGAVLKVVEEPYTMREARIHLRHVRDLLRSVDPSDAYAGVEGASLSAVNTVTQQAPSAIGAPSPPNSATGNGHGKQRNTTSTVGDHHHYRRDMTVDCTPAEFVLPGAKERPLTPLVPQNAASVAVDKMHCLKSLALSGYNPPPGYRKLKGDIIYLTLLTQENRRYQLTCCTRGFYVNQSTGDDFNPKPSNPKAVYHSLIDLLSHLSQAFKRSFFVVQKGRNQRHIFERLPTPYQIYAWAVPSHENTLDHLRAEELTQPHRIGLEDHIPGQIRDWNEELQTTHELPRKTLPERLIRERAIFKIHSDFVAAAVKGAQAVVDGNVMAINPGDDPRTHMFIWNNLFFSLGFDVKDHYKALGGDAAAFVAPTSDLQGVKAYSALDTDKLFTLGMVIVDYRGYRVTAQSIIPGILEREQEQSVVYGSVDFGTTVVTNDKYQQLLERPAQQLKIYPHMVKSGKEGEPDVKLYSSFETKGIIGNDGRHYVLDLLRTFPPDVNYLPDAEVTEICRANGYPRPFVHKLACLRQELIDAFVESRYVTFVRIAAYHLQQLRLKQLEKESTTADGAATTLEEDTSEQTNDSATPGTSGKAPTCNGVRDLQESERTSSDSGIGICAMDTSSGATQNGTTTTDCDGDRIVKEIKSKITANCSDRDSSPTVGVGCEDQLPEPETAKRIVEEKLTRNRKASNSSAAATETTTSVDDSAAKEEKETADASDWTNEDATREIIRKTAVAVNSLSETEFDIRFNPDCYCTTVEHAETEEQLEKQRKLVREAAQFLLVHQIPNFVRDVLDHTMTPMDGCGLSEALHNRGINIRYLGKLIQCTPDLPQLSYFKAVCACELLCRSAKHHIRGYLQSVAQSCLATAVAHYLNCLLGFFSNPTATVGQDELKQKGGTANRQRKSGRSDSGNKKNSTHIQSTDWAQLTPKSLWTQLCAEADSYYGYQLNCDDMESFCAIFDVQPMSMLRRFCLVAGIQMFLKDYQFDNASRGALTEDDVAALYPVVKHCSPRAADASNFLHTGQAKIGAGQLRAGFDLVAEALNLMNNVYGAMHAEIAQCMRLLARLAYILGDPTEALSQQHKATIMSERCCGIDHPQTIVEYMNLAHFSFANMQITTALKLLYRARYLLLLINGENHPLMAQIDSNIGVILYAVQEYDFSLKYLESAARLHTLYTGRNSLKTALLHHLMARSHSCRGDFRTALQNEKETFTIYCNTFGEQHEKTKESGECLKHLTQQAVTFQKRMNEASKKQGTTAISHLLPLQIQQPSLQNILEVLNILNGIIFIHLGKEKGADEKESQLTVKEITDVANGISISERDEDAVEAKTVLQEQEIPVE